jgi:GT2 family glycosyltransferase
MISVIICSVNPLLFSRIRSHYDQLLAPEPHEIIGIHDARGICEGYNRGLAQSKGDLVIFSHDDIEIWTPDFYSRLRRHMQRFDIVGVAGTSRLIGAAWAASAKPYTAGQITQPVVGEFQVSFFGACRRAMADLQALDGLFLAFRRDVIQSVGWDADTFRGFHCYDIDCTYRAFRQGYKLAAAIDIPIFHQSGGNYDTTWQSDADRFMAKHGAQLDTLPPHSYQTAIVQVRTRQDAQSLMHQYYQPLPE